MAQPGDNWSENGVPGLQTEEQEIAPYLAELAKLAPLTLRQERQLVNELVATPRRRQEIMHCLVEGNLQLGVHLARYYQGRGIALAELIGEANLALCQAAESFIPAPGRTFRIYAQKAVRWALLRLFKGQPQVVKEQPEDSPTEPFPAFASLDAPLPREERWSEDAREDEHEWVPTTLLEQLANSPAFILEEPDWAQIFDLHQALAALPRLDERVLRLRYRIGEEQASPGLRSLAEVGKILQATQERMRQREQRAFRTLRKTLFYGIPRAAAVGEARLPVPPRQAQKRSNQRTGMPATPRTQLRQIPQTPPQAVSGTPAEKTEPRLQTSGVPRTFPTFSPQSMPPAPPRFPDSFALSGMGKSWTSKLFLAEILQEKAWQAIPYGPLQKIQGAAGTEDKWISSLQWSPDGARLALVGQEGGLWIDPIRDGKAVNALPVKQQMTSPLCWSPDGAFLAVGTRTGDIALWNTRTGTLSRSYSMQGRPPSSLSWSSDGRFFAAANQNLLIWNVSEAASIPTVIYKPRWRELHLLSWSPGDAATLAAGLKSAVLPSWLPISEQAVILERVTGRPRKAFSLAGELIALVWAPDGKFLATITKHADKRRRLTIWDAGSGHVCTQTKIRLAEWLSWPANRKTIALLSRDGWLTLPDETGALRERILVTSKEIELAAWSPDGRQLALVLSGEPGVWLWNMFAISLEPDSLEDALIALRTGKTFTDRELSLDFLA